jgi:hypothetical protein
MYRTLNTLHLFVAATALLLAVLAAPVARAWAGEPAAPDQCTLYFSYPLTGVQYLISWRDNSDNEDGFTVEWWTKARGRWVLQETQDVPANTIATRVDAAAATNRYRVRAFNASGVSKWSNWTDLK